MYPPPPHPPFLPYKVDTSRPSLRTNWTRLVPFPQVPAPALRLLGPAGRAAVGRLPGHPTRERIPRLQRDVRTLLAPMRALPRPGPPRCGPFPLRACANRQHAYLFRGTARVLNRKGRPCAAPHRRALRRGRRQVSLARPTRPRAAPLHECDRGPAAAAGGGRCGVRRAVAERGRAVALPPPFVLSGHAASLTPY